MLLLLPLKLSLKSLFLIALRLSYKELVLKNIKERRKGIKKV